MYFILVGRFIGRNHWKTGNLLLADEGRGFSASDVMLILLDHFSTIFPETISIITTL